MAARIRRDRYGILLLSPGGDSSSFFRSVEQTRAFGLGRELSLLFSFCPLVIVPCLSFWSNIVTAFAHCTTITLLLCGSSRAVAKYNGFLSHLDVGYCEQGSKDLRTTQSPFSPSLTGRTNPRPPQSFFFPFSSHPGHIGSYPPAFLNKPSLNSSVRTQVSHHQAPLVPDLCCCTGSAAFHVHASLCQVGDDSHSSFLLGRLEMICVNQVACYKVPRAPQPFYQWRALTVTRFLLPLQIIVVSVPFKLDRRRAGARR